MNGLNGKPTEYPENTLVPYPVILAASKGAPDAMKIVLQHFSGYIASLSMRKLYDERGNVYFGVDEEIRERLQVEKVVGGYTGFLFLDKNGMPLVAMHWEHRFNGMVGRYNEIYKVQMSNITPHVCRHTYCSNMAKSGMNPKTL